MRGVVALLVSWVGAGEGGSSGLGLPGGFDSPDCSWFYGFAGLLGGISIRNGGFWMFWLLVSVL